MGRKKLLAALGCLVLGTAAACAQVISFQIIQRDTVQTEIRSVSYMLENGLFDYFFNKGYIATNSPTAVSGSEAEARSVAYAALSEASEGLCDYFVSVSIDCAGSSTNPAALLLSNIRGVSWNVFDVKTGTELSSGSKAPTLTARNNNEKGVKSFSAQVAAEIESALPKSGTAKGW